MERHYPEISFPLEHSRGRDSEPLTFNVQFHRGRDDAETRMESRGDDEDWDCDRVSLPSSVVEATS